MVPNLNARRSRIPLPVLRQQEAAPDGKPRMGKLWFEGTEARYK